MAIDINVKVEEQPDGSVNVRTKTISVGTTKEMAHAVVIIETVDAACKALMKALGGSTKQLEKFGNITPIGRG